MSEDQRVKNLLDTTNKGKKATEVLENSEFNSSFDTIMDGITTKLETLDVSDERKVASAVLEYQVAMKFKNRLVALMQQGKEDQSTLTKLLNRIKGD